MQPASRFRIRAEALAIALLLAGCAGTTFDTHDDLTVSTQVKIALLDDVRLGGDRLDATTLHGVVTLSGTVASQADIDRAIAIASKVPGVKDVKSELKIGSGPRPPIPATSSPS